MSEFDNWATGVDVSGWDDQCDWPVIKQQPIQITFGWAKATEGISYVNRYYQSQFGGLNYLGAFAGSYHYWWANLSGLEQGRWYLKNSIVGPLGDLIDVEDGEGLADGAPAAAAVKAAASLIDCCDVIAQARGKYPRVYTGDWFWSRFLGNAKKVSDSSDAFIAEYTEPNDVGPVVPKTWPKWYFWQFTSKGVIKGLAQACDIDKFHGTLADLKAYLAGTTPPVIQPPAPVLMYNATLSTWTWVLTVRKGPGPNYPQVYPAYYLVKGQVFQVVAIDPPTNWGQISINGFIKGWVNLACTKRLS